MRKRFFRFLTKHAAFLICAAAAAAGSFFFLSALSVYAAPLSSGISDLSADENDLNGWEVYTDENGVRMPLVFEGGGYFSGLAPGQTFYASRVITEAYEEPVLQVEGGFPVAIFLDGSLLYTDEPSAGIELGSLKFSGEAANRVMPLRITLPMDTSGKTLTIAQAQAFSEKPNQDGSVFFGPVTLYDNTALQSVYTSQAVQTAYPAMLLAVLGFSLAALFLFQLWHKKADLSILFLALFTLLWMVDTLLRSGLSYYYGSASGIVEQYLYFGCFVFLSLFLLNRMRYYRRLFLPFIITQAAAVALGALSALLPYGELSVFLMSLPQLVSFLSIWAGIGFSVAEACRGSLFFRLLVRLLAIFAVLFALFYAVSAFSGTGFYQEFNANMAAAFQTGLFYYPLVFLRYLLIFSCFLAVFTGFVQSAAQRSIAVRMLELKNRMAQESYGQMRRYTEQAMRLRHDLKKHLSAVDAFLRAGKHKQAEGYLREIGASFEEGAQVSNTGNYLIDTILSSKFSEAEQKGICAQLSYGPIPAQLPIADTDLCSLLLNSLENALTAACKIKDTGRFLSADIHIKNGFLCYSCENSSPPAPAGAPEDGAYGYGLRIMEQIAEKYSGALEAGYTDTGFRLCAALSLRCGQRER